MSMNAPALLRSVICLLTLAFSVGAQAVAVDLNLWTAEGDGTWTVQSGNDAVLQSINGSATVFYDGTTTAQGQALNGKIVAGNDGDDDFVGFVLGYTAAAGLGDGPTDFFLIDWKQGNQTNAGVLGNRGLAISHVTNGNAAFNDFWGHVAANGVTEIQRGATLGDTGWVDNVENDFNLVFTSSLIQVTVNNVLELSITPTNVAGISSFANGSFGFWNLSQSQVTYSNVTTLDCSVTPNAPECQIIPTPAPGTLALLGLALLGLRRVSRG